MDMTTSSTSSIGLAEVNLYSFPLLTPSPQPIVSDVIVNYVTFSLHYVIHFIIQIFGILANVTNIVIFLKVGMDDSVTISFFALAISDLFYLSSYMTTRAIKLVDLDYPWSKLPYMINFYNALFLDLSTLVTVFTAVQKSCCVALPFTFKNIFTRRVSVYVIALIYLIVIGSYIPFLSSHGFKSEFSPAKNATEMTYFRLKRRTDTFFYWRLLYRTIMPVVALILVIFSSVILTVKLKSSIRFRQSSKHDAAPSSSSDKSDVGMKEKRVIQAVNTVTVIFCVCNLPENVLHFITMTYPAFRRGQRYMNLYQVLSSCQNTLFMLNASVNILVYLKYNTRFYKAFKHIFKGLKNLRMDT